MQLLICLFIVRLLHLRNIILSKLNESFPFHLSVNCTRSDVLMSCLPRWRIFMSDAGRISRYARLCIG